MPSERGLVAGLGRGVESADTAAPPGPRSRTSHRLRGRIEAARRLCLTLGDRRCQAGHRNAACRPGKWEVDFVARDVDTASGSRLGTDPMEMEAQLAQDTPHAITMSTALLASAHPTWASLKNPPLMGRAASWVRVLAKKSLLLVLQLS
jgi:hypothetical protein